MELKARFPNYLRLLYLYPNAYRKLYGEQILQTLADTLDDAPQQKVSIWMRILLDLPISVLKRQIRYTRPSMTNNSPTYIKNGALLGAALLLPVFLLATARTLDT